MVWGVNEFISASGNLCFTLFVFIGSHTNRWMYPCDQKGQNQDPEGFCVLSACSRGVKSLCVLSPGPPLTHNAVLLYDNKYPKDNSEGRQRMKMKRRVGACCASERGHGSAGSTVSPRCRLLFDVQDSEWAWFLMLCNFEDGVFEVMHELDSFPASSWFVFVFFHQLFLLFEPFFLYERRSYVFEVKECFKGICWSAHCGSGLCCAHALIVSLK